jgi:hypothetical protein
MPTQRAIGDQSAQTFPWSQSEVTEERHRR